MFRKLVLCCVLGSCVTLLLGCPKKKEDAAPEAGVEEAGAVDAAPPPPAVPPAPVTKNGAEVARFPAAEKPLVDDTEKTVDLFAQAKTGCKSGNNVALVRAGTDPFKIAEFQDCILVTFADPKDASAQLMGWIPKAAFTLAAPRDAGVRDAAVVVIPGKCPGGQESVVNVAGGAGVCRKKCTTDKDCRTPSVNACAAATTAAGHITKVCANELP